MRIKLFYVQNNDGSGQICNRWTLNGDTSTIYGYKAIMNEAEIEVPDTWTIDHTLDMIYDENGNYTYYMELSNINEIKIATNNYPYVKTIWKR